MISIAFLVRRAQDLRLAAASMTQAAIRLNEPESAAAHKIAPVGQAVRREVNAIGDGLERALSRAGELEVMVHNEVTALERTYSDNETRMRQLIEELSSQRESVVTNSERMREAIAAVHGNVSTDLESIGTAITERLRRPAPKSPVRLPSMAIRSPAPSRRRAQALDTSFERAAATLSRPSKTAHPI